MKLGLGNLPTENLMVVHDGGAFVVHGIEDYENILTSYVIVEAESHEKASEMFRNHPHFNIFPGDSVEIKNCLEIPRS